MKNLRFLAVFLLFLVFALPAEAQRRRTTHLRLPLGPDGGYNTALIKIDGAINKLQTDTPAATVLDFGAQCNGSADDTIPIQAAFDAAQPDITESRLGGEVRFPCNKTCIITEGIEMFDGTRVVGCGRRSSILKSTGTDHVLEMPHTTGSVENWSIQGITLDGSNTAADGLHVNDKSSAWMLEDVTIRNVLGDGIEFADATEDGLMSHVVIRSAGAHGIYMHVTSGPLDKISFHNIRVDTTGEKGIFIDATGATANGLDFINVNCIAADEECFRFLFVQSTLLSNVLTENCSCGADDTYPCFHSDSGSNITILNSVFLNAAQCTPRPNYGLDINTSHVAVINTTAEGKTNGVIWRDTTGFVLNSTFSKIGESDLNAGTGLVHRDPATDTQGAQRAVFIGANIRPDATTHTYIPSMPGKDLRIILVDDSNASDGSGSVGDFIVRRLQDTGGNPGQDLATIRTPAGGTADNTGEFLAGKFVAASGGTFGDLDTMPSVATGQNFTTANTGATEITDFLNEDVGQSWAVRCGDTNTTFDFGQSTSTTLFGNNGVDLVCEADMFIHCTSISADGKIYCLVARVSDNQVITGSLDLQGNLVDSTGEVSVGDDLEVTGTADFQGDISDSNSDVTIDDGLIVTGSVSDSDSDVKIDDGLIVTGAVLDDGGDLTLNDIVLIQDLVRTVRTDTPTACSATYEGSVYYDSSKNELCFCNGTNYCEVAAPATCNDANGCG